MIFYGENQTLGAAARTAPDGAPPEGGVLQRKSQRRLQSEVATKRPKSLKDGGHGRRVPGSRVVPGMTADDFRVIAGLATWFAAPTYPHVVQFAPASSGP